MTLALLLRSQMPCPACDGIAHLQEGTLEREIGEGIKVIVHTVPVYRCPECGEEFMELKAASALEEALAPSLAEIQPNRVVTVRIHWEKSSRRSKYNSACDAKFVLPEKPEMEIACVP